MNYSKINDTEETISLDEKVLSESEVKGLLAPLIKKDGLSLVPFELWGPAAEESWTIVIMSAQEGIRKSKGTRNKRR